MPRYGFLFDQNLCIGCNACQMACKDGHDLELGLFFRRVNTFEYTDDNGKTIYTHYSGACNHCENPACVNKCPTGAMFVQADGTVGHDDSRCIGCGVCTWACPYKAPKLSHKTGRAAKCDSCYSRRNEGKEPLCVEACLTHCLKFVNLDALSEEEKADCTNTLEILPSPERTEPNLIIKTKGGKDCE
ncbi:MAG: 4Fe-4S dicluster domain-containing protein [Clostridia bacterium]|nr:4Fe-4S dicluster domain-containing protein [Clostridia bacterium]